MPDSSPRATGSVLPSERADHVRDTFGATLLFLLALAFAAVVSAPPGGEAVAAAVEGGLPGYAAGS